MIDVAYLLRPIPAEWFDAESRLAAPADVIRDLIVELLAARRKLAVHPNDERERARAEDTCDLLAEVLRRLPQEGSEVQLSVLSGDTLISQTLNGTPEGGLVFTPQELAANNLVLDLTGAEVVRKCVTRGDGLARLPIFLANSPSRYPDRPVGLAPIDSRPAEPEAGVSVEDRLRWRVETALRGGPPVNMNNQKHTVFTTVFQEFLIKKGPPGGTVRVVYGDGSEARPFPLRCLQPTRPREEAVMPVSLMSMRHLQLDGQVVFNWLRNREIDQSSTLAVADSYCYLQSIERLQSLRSRVGAKRLHILMYHTGFEPAVVGFYRAVVESLLDGSDWLCVTPHFFADDGFRTGQPWPPPSEDEASHGA